MRGPDAGSREAAGLQSVTRDGKTLATFQAIAALAGYELVLMADGTLVGARSGVPGTACTLASLDQLDAWLEACTR